MNPTAKTPIAPGATIWGLRFPQYHDGADSPKAIVCTGVVTEILGKDDTVVAVIQSEDVHLQPHEVPSHQLRNGLIQLESPWIFTNEKDAREAYFRMVDQDLRENLTEMRRMERRVNRIRAERDAAGAGLE